MAYPNDHQEPGIFHQNNSKGHFIDVINMTDYFESVFFHFHNPPEVFDDETGYSHLFRPSIFPPVNIKGESSSHAAQVSSPAAPVINTGVVPRTARKKQENPPKTLIEPPKVIHRPFNQALIDSLHPTLKRIIDSWSGETRECQERVLNKMIKELSPESQNSIRHFKHGTDKVDIKSVRRLSQLCGPGGALCLVNRNGSQSGVSSIVCAKCQKSFDGNPVQTYAHHLLTFHWNIKPFVCCASDCGKRFAWTHDRDRHERSKHHLYRRKAYELAMKEEAWQEAVDGQVEAPHRQAETTAYHHTAYPPPDPKVYQAFKGYNHLSNTWES